MYLLTIATGLDKLYWTGGSFSQSRQQAFAFQCRPFAELAATVAFRAYPRLGIKVEEFQKNYLTRARSMLD